MIVMFDCESTGCGEQSCDKYGVVCERSSQSDSGSKENESNEIRYMLAGLLTIGYH